MDAKKLIFLITVSLSITSSVYGIYLTLYSYPNNTSPVPVAPAPVKLYIVIPLSIAVIGWLLTLYQVRGIRGKNVSRILRRKLSGNEEDKQIYQSFKKRGGINRLSIMDSLDTPKLRNQIAKKTNIDWKEVDRNLRVLESIDLVRIQYKNGSFSVYELTQRGKEVLAIVKTTVDETQYGT